MQDKKAITRFVKDSLGCRCPDEVFNRIDITNHAQAKGIPLLARMVVGNRLLIYVAESHGEAVIRSLVQTGLQERDNAGLNRFRLVIASRDPLAEANPLYRAFEAARDGDGKTHLHVIDLNDSRLAEVLALRQ